MTIGLGMQLFVTHTIRNLSTRYALFRANLPAIAGHSLSLTSMGGGELILDMCLTTGRSYCINSSALGFR